MLDIQGVSGGQVDNYAWSELLGRHSMIFLVFGEITGYGSAYTFVMLLPLGDKTQSDQNFKLNLFQRARKSTFDFIMKEKKNSLPSKLEDELDVKEHTCVKIRDFNDVFQYIGGWGPFQVRIYSFVHLKYKIN